MLRFQPKRLIEDVFMNIHNPMITRLLMCNNNVQIGMNGRSVLYSTGYQVKSQQKEERNAFEKVSNVLCKVIQKQVRTKTISTYNRKYFPLTIFLGGSRGNHSRTSTRISSNSRCNLHTHERPHRRCSHGSL
jgi:argonaute-like protein implicated in RNA metabolism and viral defense